MTSSNPLAAAEAALVAQWQDPAYLLSNAQALVNGGQLASTIELTYRQMAQRLHFTYSPNWATGTSFEAMSRLSDAEISAQAAADVDAHTAPTIQFVTNSAGASLSLSHAGSLSYSVSGVAGSATGGETALTPGASAREGVLTVTRDNGQASTTSTYLFIGTGTGASFSYSSAPTTNRLIILGGGNDAISAGQGNDTIYGGEGNDSLYANQGQDLVYGQAGDDTIQSGQGNDTVYGGAGNDIIDGGTTGNDQLTGGEGADQFQFSTNRGTDTVTDFSAAQGDTISLADGTGASAEPHFAAIGTASGAALSASDFDTVSTIADIRSDTGGAGSGNDQLYVVTTAQSSSQITAAVASGATSAYALVYDSSAGEARLYYDTDWSDAAGRVQIASFTGMSLSDVQALTISNFMVWA